MRLEDYTTCHRNCQRGEVARRRFEWDEFLAGVRGLHVYLLAIAMVGAVWVSGWAQAMDSKRMVYYPALPMPVRRASAAAAKVVQTMPAVVADLGLGED